MTWPMPPGQWNPGITMASEMSMGSYTPEQWAMMQQQNWQWAQWQQQYAQWQSQYGDKYAQQLQSMQAMGMAPPLPPSNVPPPAPPPPENPPPPPHENDEPLFGTSKAPAPVPPANINQIKPLSTNMPSTTQNINQPTTNATSETPQTINSDALKKLAEEERIFDIQFKKWEEEIEKWRQDNVNHPDKRAYSEYEQKFEACRAQLLERRQQMKQKRAKLLSNVSTPVNTKNAGNISTNVPAEQFNKSNNYTKNIPPMQQNYKDSGPAYNNRNIPQSQQYKMSQHNYNRGDINREPQDRIESYEHTTEIYDPIASHNTFLPSSSSAKGIPGLDLVPDEKSSFLNQPDVIDITNDHDSQQQSKPSQKNLMDLQTQPSNIGPDYSTISQGINNILGDEKIMNILSMVAGQKTENSLNVNIAPPKSQSSSNNQWRNDHFDNRHPTDFRNQNDNNFPPHQQNRFSNPPPSQGHHIQRYDNRQNETQDQYYNNNQGNQNMHLRNMPPPLMQTNTPRPLLPNLAQKYPEQPHIGSRMGMHEHSETLNPSHPQFGPDNRQVQSTNIHNSSNQRGLLENREPLIPNNPHTAPEHRMLEQIEPRAMSPMKPKWATDPLFTPSIIVEYEHKPLRLKARDFIEPVHTFDYNHISKDNEGVNKRKFEEEAEQLFARKSKQLDTKDWNHDRYTRDVHHRDNRQLRRDVKDDYYDSERGDHFYQRRHDNRRLEDRERINRFSDTYKDKEYDRTREPRERNSGKDYDRNYERKDSGRDRDLGRDRDFGRDRAIGRDKDYGRDRDGGPYRLDVDRDRDNGRDRYRDRKTDRNRSHSRERDNHKRGISKESEVSNNSASKKSKTMPSNESPNKPKHVIMIDDILEPPGREMRPLKIVIVLRGPPGSGKSYLAKLIRDREAEHGGTARIMSIDDYFMQEGEIEEKDPTTGKIVKKPSLKYEYDESLEETYLNSLKRAFKRSLTDGYFSFLIYDAVNDQLKGYADIWNFARQNGFQVYICTMDLDPQVCFKRNIHNRKLEEIEVICSRFFPTPAHHLQLDATTLLQSASIPDVHMEDVSNEDIVDITMDEEPEVENSFSSKWEKMDDAAQLARLDGINKPLRPSQLSMEDYLQLDDWKPNTAKPGKKTVRWADLEERRQQEKMRAIGFVVGQTDWNRMTDPTMGSSALTQTKYIERVRRN